MCPCFYGFVEGLALDRNNQSGGPLVLDFRAPAGHVKAVTVNGAPARFTTPADHIVIPAGAITAMVRWQHQPKARLISQT